jgi:hypothetical protein
MTAVPQAAVDAAMKAMGCEPDANEQFCASCNNASGSWEGGGCATAAAVVAAVQGPIKAEALREAAQEWRRFTAGGRCPTCQMASRETVGMVCQTCGTDYADRIEAQP